MSGSLLNASWYLGREGHVMRRSFSPSSEKAVDGSVILVTLGTLPPLTYWMTRVKIKVMQEVSISEFKAKCLGLIDEVQKTRQPLRILRRGKPVAEVIPAGPDRTRKFVGDMVGTGKILGDIESPIIDWDEMEIYRK
jgi:prevent-host-death family protein